MDLEFISKQSDRLLEEIAGLRNDVRVLTAIMMRRDTAMGQFLEELRATHAQVAGTDDRGSRPEDADK